jgi:hypothetical protein
MNQHETIEELLEYKNTVMENPRNDDFYVISSPKLCKMFKFWQGELVRICQSYWRVASTSA